MDDTSKEKDGADPRRSIAAFLEAARQEGLLSDAIAETLGRFHQRLLSPPPVAEPTDAERRLWRELRRRQIHGYKFRRQCAIGDYVVDFVFLEKRIVIELDGGQHANTTDYDEQRTNWLEAQGFRVMRFWNNDVMRQTDAVLRNIEAALLSI